MTWNDLLWAVDEWAESRGIFNGSNPQAQLLKAVSELGELCDAEIKGIVGDQQDAVGDVLVCLIIYCGMKNYDMRHCLELAYEEIKNRKGRMIAGGAFVKEV
jgi:NTP pyrophosphatase (non-canonical NTP hydrolase)